MYVWCGECLRTEIGWINLYSGFVGGVYGLMALLIKIGGYIAIGDDRVIVYLYTYVGM